MIFKLLDDEVESQHQKCRGNSAGSIGNHDGGNGRDNRAEKRNGFERRRKYREKERVFDADNGKTEKNQHANQNREQYLALHPEPDFPLCPLPEPDDIRFAFNGSNDPKKVGHSVFLHREIEREHYDENEAYNTAEEDADVIPKAFGEA